ncbi:MAG: AarF/UbiB family protein [Lachnospiraceae bacterium]|jgi:ubiquinone biosynthesis protein
MDKSSDSKKESSRLAEVTRVLRQHEVMRGMTPEKLCAVMEDLGPTYIKLGQLLSNRSDILPKEYCDALNKLRTEVEPMPFEDVISVIEESYGCKWNDVFQSIDQEPLGSASIAQVHRAVLQDGDEVVVKVQRRGIYDTMKRDVNMMKRMIRFLPATSFKSTLNLDQTIDELWFSAQEEMNFLTEASNMESFERCNRDVRFIDVPKLYRQYTTEHVLVMEYIDYIPINDRHQLQSNGYDLREIGTKLVDNYMKQVMDDGFFHADPHQGNVGIRDGRIVWFDMGMMGRLTQQDREAINLAVEGISEKDTGKVEDAIMGLGEFRGAPKRHQLYKDVDNLMLRYFSLDFGDIDVAEVIQSLLEIMKNNNMVMPQALTLLARGLTQIEGVLMQICPDISIMEVARNRMQQYYLDLSNLRKALKEDGFKMVNGYKAMIELPSQASRLLRNYEKGQTRINLDLHSSEELTLLLHHLTRNMVIGLWVAALLIGSSILCTTDMVPKIMGIPFLGALGFLAALVIAGFVFIRFCFRRLRQRRQNKPKKK